MVHPHGSFCWFELGTSDQAAAKSFYQSLFGWDAEDSPMGPNELYTIFRLGGLDVAAAYTLRAEQQAQHVAPHWMLYVAVDDADRCAARAAGLGGTVFAAPFDVTDFGRMAVLQDPGGAWFSIWQARKHGGTDVTGRVDNTFCWADLSTPDQDQAAAFYSDLFGWRMVAGKDMAPAVRGDYFHIANGADLIGGINPSSQGDPGTPPGWLIYAAVPDCRDAEGRAATLGAQIYASTFPIGEEGSVAILADPQGAVFGLHQN